MAEANDDGNWQSDLKFIETSTDVREAINGIRGAGVRSVVIFADDDESWHQLLSIDRDAMQRNVEGTFATSEILMVQKANVVLPLIEQLTKAEATLDHILLILDLQFPDYKDGLGVLNSMKMNANPKIRRIPVVIYSVQADEDEVAETFKRRADAYSIKDDHPKPFFDILSAAGRVIEVGEAMQDLRWPNWSDDDTARSPSRKAELAAQNDLDRSIFLEG